jgi:acyl carrier protein
MSATPATSVDRKSKILEELMRIMQDLSGMDESQIDVHRTFLELGFDSLFLAQANGAFKKAFKVRITTRQLMEKMPTLAALAEHLDRELPPEAFKVEEPVVQQPTAQVAIQDAGVPAAPMLSNLPLGTQVAVGSGSPLETLIVQQLQLMQQQLAALRGEGVSSAVTAQVAATHAPATSAAVGDATKSQAGRDAVGDTHDKTSPWQPVEKKDDGTLSETQKEHIDKLVQRVLKRTPGSKEMTQANRARLSDPRTVQGFRKQWKEIVYPIVSDRAEGSKIWDVDGNEYIDVVTGYGSNFLGHAPKFVLDAVREQISKTVAIGPQTPLAGQVAELICEMTGMERAAFCNTGSEAVLAAIRCARTVTGRTKLATFAGHYHGIFDEVLVKGMGQGARRKSLPIAPGIPGKKVEDVVVLEYGNPESLDVIRENADELALVLVEPVRSRNPDLRPIEFLHSLRALTEELDIPILFDEMVTGFRTHPGGAQHLFGVRADLATYGKVFGGGFPIG